MGTQKLSGRILPLPVATGYEPGFFEFVQRPLIYHRACDNANGAAWCGLCGVDVTGEDNVGMLLAVNASQKVLVDNGSRRVTSGVLSAGS